MFEVYVSLPQHTLKKEARRLAGFAKTKLLDAGETEKVIVEIPLTYLTSFDEEESSYVLESGDYIIWAGNSLAGAQAIAKAELDESVCMEKVKVICPFKESPEEDLNDKNRPEITVKQDIPCIKLNAADIHTRKVLYRDNCDIYEKEAMDFVNTLSVDELIQLSSGDPGKAQGGNLGAAGISVPGSAGETNVCAVEKGLASIVLADGPAGLRLMKYYHVNDNRMGSDSIVSERALREIYLRGFEIAVKESQPMAIMTSYNLINGVHAANNYDLCTNVARNEWGFKGLIMTDWTTTEIDESCTAAGCMHAGNDLVMPGCFGDRENLKKELSDGTLDIKGLKVCIARLANVCFKSNQYE